MPKTVPKNPEVKLNDKQFEVIGNLSRGVRELQERLDIYIRGIADSNGIAEEFTASGLDAETKVLSFAPRGK